MEWISVKDRLPELDSHVLVTDGGDISTAVFLESSPLYPGAPVQQFVRDCGGSEDWDLDYAIITHWQPLPDLPNKTKEMK